MWGILHLPRIAKGPGRRLDQVSRMQLLLAGWGSYHYRAHDTVLKGCNVPVSVGAPFQRCKNGSAIDLAGPLQGWTAPDGPPKLTLPDACAHRVRKVAVWPTYQGDGILRDPLKGPRGRRPRPTQGAGLLGY